MRELLEQFFRHYLRERNLEDTLALLTDQVISLGTGEQEVARNKEELRALMECEFKEMPQPLDYELFNYTENPLGEYGWSIFTNVLAKIDSEGVTMEMLTRLTCICVKEDGKYEILGRTRDDAAGEAYDKVARAIGLGYPGGPKIDRIAKEGNPDAIQFPKAKVNDAEYDFSFSGLKSAVLNYINGCKMKGETFDPADLAASFQKAVVDVLVEHTMLAAGDYKMTKVAIAGGVASNGTLRAAMEKACAERGYTFYRPSPIFCTDNAAMIGVAAYYEYMKGTRHGWDLNAVPNLKLGER